MYKCNEKQIKTIYSTLCLTCVNISKIGGNRQGHQIPREIFDCIGKRVLYNVKYLLRIMAFQ